MKRNLRLLLLLPPLLLLYFVVRGNIIVDPIPAPSTPVSVAGSPAATASTSPTPLPSYLATLRIDDHEMEDDYRPARFRSAEAQVIRAALPEGAFLRDFALLQGTDSYLVLYVINPSVDTKESVMDFSDSGDDYFPMWCGAGDFGQAMYGAYSLTLIRGRNIVNTVDIPFPDMDAWPKYTLETPTADGIVGYSDINDPSGAWNNHGGLMFRKARCMLEDWWKEDRPCLGAGIDFLETRLLRLMDMTGDGLPYEARLMTEYLSCGNRYYVIAGYDKEADRATIFSVVDGDGVLRPSFANFNPRADGSAILDTGCDHGKTDHVFKYYRFNPKLKAYELYHSSDVLSCE